MMMTLENAVCILYAIALVGKLRKYDFSSKCFGATDDIYHRVLQNVERMWRLDFFFSSLNGIKYFNTRQNMR